jgi:hypothetical protein
MRREKCLNYSLNCQNHRLDGLKDSTEGKSVSSESSITYTNKNHGFDGLKDFTEEKSVQSASSVAICDSDNVQKEIDQYLTQLAK